MREKSCSVFLHTNDFSPYTYFSEHGMLFLSSMYKMVLFCFGRVGYKCMLSSVCRHLAICADLMNCTGGKKIQIFSVSYADHFFQLVPLCSSGQKLSNTTASGCFMKRIVLLRKSVF